MARITRKQLKQDRFAEEVGQSVAYVSSHRKQVLILGVVVVAAVIGILAYVGYQSRVAREAEAELQRAIEMYHGVVNTEQQMGRVTFPTTIARFRDTTEQLEKVIREYAGREEEAAAQYYLALLEIEQEKIQEAQTRLESLLDRTESQYASLARLVLANLYARQQQDEQARRHYEHLIEHPSRVVPKSRAQLAYAEYLAQADPEAAKALIEEMQKQPGPASVQAARVLRQIEGS